MKKSTIAIILVVLFGLVAGSAIWLSLSSPSNTADSAETTDMNHGSDTQSGNSNVVDMTDSMEVSVAMRDISFAPAHIKIKKGATVTWTNNDTVGHNVVAETPTSSGGLPTSHPLLNKGETFSHTFETVGTFAYYCTPHPFMKGSVEVVE